MFRFTMVNHFCKDMEQLHDPRLSPDRIRQDVSRSPGGDSRLFLNNCIGCHNGMDPLAGAYATVWPAGESPVTLDGGVEMPGRGLEPDRFGRGLREAVLEYAGGVRTFVGHGSIGTPGALAALATLSRRHGRLPWLL